MPLDISKTLLLEVDVQNDFCPSGALAVPGGDEVIAPLNALATAFAAVGGRAAATQDWHPAGHISFASAHKGHKTGDIIDTPGVKGQVLWPDHCVQGSWGAAFHDRLDQRPISLVVRKGFRMSLDSYSAFFENDRKTPTGLEGWIRGLGIDTLIIGGLAADYCVFYSAMDARHLGLTVIIASDAVRGVDYPAGLVQKAMDAMRTKGIGFAASAELLKDMR